MDVLWCHGHCWRGNQALERIQQNKAAGLSPSPRAEPKVFSMGTFSMKTSLILAPSPVVANCKWMWSFNPIKLKKYSAVNLIFCILFWLLLRNGTQTDALDKAASLLEPCWKKPERRLRVSWLLRAPKSWPVNFNVSQAWKECPTRNHWNRPLGTLRNFFGDRWVFGETG